MFVCLYVCPSIFDTGAGTASRIGTGGYSFDAQEWWKDDGIGFGTIECMWHVPHAIAQIIGKNL